MEVILLRHGEAQGNRERRFLGVTDSPLTGEGEAAARRLSGHIPPVDRVYTSPLSRCRRTAELVWPGVERRAVKGLRETDFGPFEGKSHRELAGDPQYEAWLADGGEHFTLGGIEPPGHTLRRVRGAVCYILRDAEAQGLERIALVSHGGAILALMTRYGPPLPEGERWLFPNCGGVRCAVTRRPLALQVLEELG